MPDGYFDSLPIPRKNVDLAGMQQNIASLQSGLAQEILDRESADATKANKSTTINGKSLAEDRVIYAQDVPSKNLLPNTASTQTINGVTFTVNSDGSISTSGTASAVVEFFIYANGYWSPSPYPFDKSQEYILSGCPTGGTDSSYSLRIYEYNGSSSTGNYKDYGSGVTFTPNSSGTGCLVMIAIQSGTNMNGKTFRPMIRLASIEDDSYVPYAKTNVELTKIVTDTPQIDAERAITSSTSCFNTGVSLTIPSDGIWVIWAGCRYGQSAPLHCAILADDRTYHNVLANTDINGISYGKTISGVVCTCTRYFSSGTVLSVGSRYSGATTNTVEIHARKLV